MSTDYDPWDPWDDMTEVSVVIRRAIVERITQLRMEVNRYRDKAEEYHHYKGAWEAMARDRPRLTAALAAVTWAETLEEAQQIAYEALEIERNR